MNHQRMNRMVALTVAMALLTSSLTVVAALAATEQVKRQAVNAGLAYLAQTQQRSGSGETTEGHWHYSNNGTLSATAAAVLAFLEDQGIDFRPGEDVIIDDVNYGDVVGYALNYIFNRAVADPRFGVEYAIYERYAEDYNNTGVYGQGNDEAIYFEPGVSSARLYNTGICVPVIYALGEKLGRHTVIDRGSAAINGKTYAQAMQDLIDWFSFAQVEPSQGNQRGGWRYDANYSTSDNSTAQWGALPLLYGRDWGLGTPQYVFNELELWVNYIQNANGGSGYSHPYEWVNVSKTGGLLLQLRAIGAAPDDPRVQNALNYINQRWNTGPSGTWDGNLNNPYAMWAVYKGLALYGLIDWTESFSRWFLIGNGMSAAPGGFTIGFDQDPLVSLAGDWYSHYIDYLVGIQNANGSWSGFSYWTGALATGWYINIIQAGSQPKPPYNPAIDLTATTAGPCVSYGETIVLHGHATYGMPGNPDPEVPPAEDVEITIMLPEHLVFASASDGGAYDEVTHSVLWDIGLLPDGEQRFVSTDVVVANTAVPGSNMMVQALVSATNVEEHLWGRNEILLEVCELPDCVIATLGDPEYDIATQHLVVPIELQGVGAFGPITGIDVVFTFDPAVLMSPQASFTGTLLSGLGWSFMWNEPQPGEFRIGLAGTQPLPGDGVLAYLKLDVVPGAPCDGCSALAIDLLLNEGDPCVHIIETPDWCLPLANVTGLVSYWGCGMVGNDYPPIPDVRLALFNSCHQDTAWTDPAGVFVVEACFDSCYTLEPWKAGGEIIGISTLDAAVVLRHVVGLDDLEACPIDPMQMQDGTMCPTDAVYPQQLAADVTGNGAITSYDASKILQYIVGADVSETLVGQWEFFCSDRTVCVDAETVVGMDFTGLLYGDVTGNYRVDPTRDTPAASAAHIQLVSVVSEPGAAVDVPLMITNADGFYGLKLQITHAASEAVVEDVTLGALAPNRMLAWHYEDGQLNVALAGAAPLMGNGELVRVRYRINDDIQVSEISLEIADVYVDENPTPLTADDGVIALQVTSVEQVNIPSTFRLYAAVPNPFNPMTTIAFDMPRSGNAVLAVYDLAGRQVRVLHSGELIAGRHEFTWYGLNAADQSMPSGTYLCRLQAADYSSSVKITLVK